MKGGIVAEADDFEVDIARWVNKVKKNVDLFKTALAENEVTRLKELTPVDTGNMRSRWHVSEITEDYIEIVNDAAYAHRVNSGFIGKDSLGRQFHQRGVHMVEQVISETPAIVRKTMEDVNDQS